MSVRVGPLRGAGIAPIKGFHSSSSSSSSNSSSSNNNNNNNNNNNRRLVGDGDNNIYGSWGCL